MAKKQERKQHTEGSVLEKYKALLVGIQAVYDKGATELPKETKDQLDFAMRDDADSLMGFFLYPVISVQMEPRLTELVFGSNRYSALAFDWAGVTKQTGYVPEGFSRYHGGKSLEALDAKRAISVPKSGGLIAAATYLEAQRGLGNILRQWVDRTGAFAERSYSGRDDKKAGVAEAIAEMAGTDPKTKLTTDLEEAKARKAKAIADDNDEELTAAVAEIKSIKAELAKLNEALKATDPKAELETKLKATQDRKAKATADDNDEELTAAVAEIKSIKAELAKLNEAPKAATTAKMDGLDAAVAACNAPTAGKGLKLMYGRWDRDELDDSQFVAGVKAMMA